MGRRPFATMLVVLAMVVSAGWAFAGAMPPGGTFTDDDGNTHEGSIEAIAAEGITKGCNPPTNDLYCPKGTVTRAQMAAFLVRALGLTDNGGGDLFIDDDGSIFENDIDKLGTAGVTKGCNPPTNDRYCPDGKVTRGQMAAFLVRAFGYTDDGGGDLFTDDDGSVFEPDIDRLGTAGVTKGCNPPENTMYCPADFVTREQMATFLTRALGLTPMTPPPRPVPLTYATPQMIAGVDLDGISATAVADFNVDGHADMVMALTSGLDSGPARAPLLLINDGQGNLVDRTAEFIDGPVPEFFNVRGLLVEDFNGDDRPDIFFNNHGKEDPPGDWGSWPCEQNRLLLSQPDGRLRDVTATNLPNIVDFSHGSSSADVDGDTDIDIWVNNLGCGAAVPGYLLQNDGQGNFTVVAGAGDYWPNGLPGSDGGPFWAQFVDANGDNVGDLMYFQFAEAGLLINDGTGVFTAVPDNWVPDAAVGRATQGSQASDLNGDGLDDVILLQTPDDFSPGHTVQILVSNGDGSFADETAQRLPTQHTSNAQGVLYVWATDIEGDGDTDLLNVSWDPMWDLGDDVFAFYVNQGDGTFQELPADQLPPIHPPMTPIDLNGDGKMDYVFVSDGVLAMTLAL